MWKWKVLSSSLWLSSIVNKLFLKQSDVCFKCTSTLAQSLEKCVFAKYSSNSQKWFATFYKNNNNESDVSGDFWELIVQWYSVI